MYTVPFMKKKFGANPILEGFTSVENIFEQFEQKQDGETILMAIYETEWYQGDAFVLFEKDGKLYEINGGHCSCYGLEGQWSPEEVLLAELVQNRFTEDSYRFESIPHIRQKLLDVIGDGKEDDVERPRDYVNPISDLELN